MRNTAMIVAVAAAAGVTVARMRAAEACSGCFSAHFVPEDGATIPANTPALYWRPGRSAQQANPAEVTLVRADAPDSPLPITRTLAPNGFDYLLTPNTPLEPGVTYTLRDPNSCTLSGGDAPKVATFTAGPAAPLPSTLGTLQATALPRVMMTVAQGASCSWQFDTARVAVDLTAAPEAAPWLDMLFFETLVDGAAWIAYEHLLEPPAPGASWQGRGADLLIAVCGDSGNGLPQFYLPEGAHAVEMRVTLPGTTLALASTTATARLSCAGAPPGDGDGGTNPPPDDAGGCCQSSAPAPGAAPLLLAAGGLLLVLRRRRRGRAAN
jgi:hypothetical protein